MKTKLLLALMACMCVVSCKKDSDATNGADDSIYGVYDAVFYERVNYQRDLFVGGKPANEVDRNLRECAEKHTQERYRMFTNCYTFDDVVKHYEGKLTDTVKKSYLDKDIEWRDNGKDGHVEMKIIPIDKSNHTAKIKIGTWEYDARVFENTIFIDFGGDKREEIDFEIKYKGGKPTKLYLMSEILTEDVNCGSAACGEQVTLKMKYVHYILCTKVREL